MLNTRRRGHVKPPPSHSSVRLWFPVSSAYIPEYIRNPYCLWEKVVTSFSTCKIQYELRTEVTISLRRRCAEGGRVVIVNLVIVWTRCCSHDKEGLGRSMAASKASSHVRRALRPWEGAKRCESIRACVVTCGAVWCDEALQRGRVSLRGVRSKSDGLERDRLSEHVSGRASVVWRGTSGNGRGGCGRREVWGRCDTRILLTEQ